MIAVVGDLNDSDQIERRWLGAQTATLILLAHTAAQQYTPVHPCWRLAPQAHVLTLPRLAFSRPCLPASPTPQPQANGADIRGGTWFETGAEMLNGGTLNYFAVPWGIVSNPLPLFVVIAIEAGLMGAVEFYRRNGSGPAGYSPGIGKFESSGE